MEEQKRPTLYAIAQEHREITDILIQTEGELTPELEIQLDALLRTGSDKLDAGAAVVRTLEAKDAELKAEADRIKARRESFGRDVANLKKRMEIVVDEVYYGKIKTTQNTFWTQDSAATTSILLAADVDLMKLAETDPSIVRTTHELNKAEVQRRLKQGESLPAEVTTQDNPGTHYLRIK